MASSAPKVYRDTGTALEIPDDKNEAFKTVAAHYACSARMGPKIVSYGAKKEDVGISYLSAVRLCSEKLESIAGWPPEVVELFVEYLDKIKAPMRQDDWVKSCFMMQMMEEEGFEDIVRDDVVEFLEEDEQDGGSFRSIHYDWLRYMQTGESTPYLYLDVAEWVPTADPAHPDFEPVKESQGPGPGAIVGAQVEEKSENPFLSRQNSTFLPSGKVQVFFPNAKDGDAAVRDEQAANVQKYTQLQASGDAEAARALKKTIMQKRISLSHRYTTILIEYHAHKGMYAGGVFHFLFRLPKEYPIKPPLCHCLTPIWHPNILHEAGSAPREQNVCCSFLHDKDFADHSEQGYEPGMSLWKVVWAICLLLHRMDTEGLGIFTLSNPLNKEAADQFTSDQAAFEKKAQEYAARYATMDYHTKTLERWHEFYPNFQEVYDPTTAKEKVGKDWKISKSLPIPGDSEGSEDGLTPIEHQAGPPDDAECIVFFIPIDTTNFVEYRAAPSGKWYSAPVCDDVVLKMLCGDNGQFAEWLSLVESLGVNPEGCNSIQDKMLNQGPPIYISSSLLLPLPDGETHIDVLFFGGGAPEIPVATASVDTPEPEPEAEVLSEFSGDGRYVSARLFGSVDGAAHAKLWELHKQVYEYNQYMEDSSAQKCVPTITVLEGPGVTPLVEEHLERLKQRYDDIRGC